jgi:hypothetical protein
MAEQLAFSLKHSIALIKKVIHDENSVSQFGNLLKACRFLHKYNQEQ